MGLFKVCGCGCNGRKQEEKLIISIISGLIFFIVANPETFRIVRAILGSWISTPTGCPSTLGLLVHTLVFILVVWGMMNIKKEGGGCTARALIRVRPHTIRGSQEWKLEVGLFVVAGVQIDGLAGILVLSKFLELHIGRREFRRLLDSERHCW